MDKIIVYLAIKYKGDWDAIYKSLNEKEPVDREEIDKVADEYTFKYTNGQGIETPRVLPAILNSDYIVCSGYASLVKAVVDKLDMPGLKCDFIGCKIVSRHKVNGHCHNIVSIKDPKYDIDGVYVEDACWDSKREGYEKGYGFGHCLYPVNDVKNFNNGKGYYNDGIDDRFSNLIINSNDFNDGIKRVSDTSKIRRKISDIKKYFKYRQIPDLIMKYGDKSEPISFEIYRKGLIELYAKFYDDLNKVNELVDEQIQNSRINSIKTFNPKAYNAFSSSVTKQERNKIKKDIKGPSATR
jgi:hypothetical protein